MDRVLLTDPIWRTKVEQKCPICLTRITGEVVSIDPSAPVEPDDADLSPEEEQQITEKTLAARSELRNDLESLFSGESWPKPDAAFEAFRKYSVKVYDVNAVSYRKAVAKVGRAPSETLRAMVRNLLKAVYGGEWENSPGDTVVRIDWQLTIEGWKGREVETVAGNDPDPNCLYHQLIGDAIQYRYRFYAPPPLPLPGESPGINISNLEWWQYIGLNERHNLAMVTKPYLEDRMSHWLFVYTGSAQTKSVQEPGSPAATANTTFSQVGSEPKKSQSVLSGRAVWLKERLRERAWNKHDLGRQGGPDHKSTQKVLDGTRVREDVLEKIAVALSKKIGKVNIVDIPEN